MTFRFSVARPACCGIDCTTARCIRGSMFQIKQHSRQSAAALTAPAAAQCLHLDLHHLCVRSEGQAAAR